MFGVENSRLLSAGASISRSNTDLDLGVARQVGHRGPRRWRRWSRQRRDALQHRQEVQGDIRVAGQAQLARPLGMPRHQLGHRVDALGIDVAGDVAVVATDVVLLRRRAVQQAAGLQVELLDADVRRQFVAAQGVQVIQLRVVGEDPFGERLEETPLQVAASGGTPQESAVYSVSWRSGRVRRRWYNALTSRLGLPSPRGRPMRIGPSMVCSK